MGEHAVFLDASDVLEIPEVIGKLHSGGFGEFRGRFDFDDAAVIKQIECNGPIDVHTSSLLGVG